MSAPLELPTPFTLVALDGTDDALAEGVRRAQADSPEGTLVWVRSPQAPRGRLDRPWLPGPDPQLHASLVLRPSLPAATCAELCVAVILALGRAIADEVEPVTELHYRWPNDVLLNHGKAAGIWLQGAGTTDSLDWVVLGWAVNAGSPPESLGFDAAGIAREGRVAPIDPGALLESTARHLLTWIERWDEDEFAPLRESWRGRLQLGEPIRLSLPDGTTVAGTAEALDEDGALTVRTEAGAQRVTLADFFGLPGQALGNRDD